MAGQGIAATTGSGSADVGQPDREVVVGLEIDQGLDANEGCLTESAAAASKPSVGNGNIRSQAPQWRPSSPIV